MGVILAPINYIEIEERGGESIVRIAGTRLTVGEVAYMHLHRNSSVDWIVENFDALNHAKVYAALSYYMDHQQEIDEYMRRAEAHAQSQATMTVDELIERTKHKIATKNND